MRAAAERQPEDDEATARRRCRMRHALNGLRSICVFAGLLAFSAAEARLDVALTVVKAQQSGLPRAPQQDYFGRGGLPEDAAVAARPCACVNNTCGSHDRSPDS